MGVICPRCGGKQIRQVTPGEFECVTPLPGGLAPPVAGQIHPMRPCSHRFQIGINVESEPSYYRREDQRTPEVSVDEQDLRKYDEIATKAVFDFLAQAAGFSPSHISFGRRELPAGPQRRRTLREVWKTRHWVGKHARKPRYEYERLLGHIVYTNNDAPWSDVPTYIHRNVWVFEEGTVSLVEGGEGPERDTALGSGRHRWDPGIGPMERQPSDGFGRLPISDHFIRTDAPPGTLPLYYDSLSAKPFRGIPTTADEIEGTLAWLTETLHRYLDVHESE
jgi:hypothetical protein